jgi:hypothetical protein
LRLDFDNILFLFLIFNLVIVTVPGTAGQPFRQLAAAAQSERRHAPHHKKKDESGFQPGFEGPPMHQAGKEAKRSRRQS